MKLRLAALLSTVLLLAGCSSSSHVLLSQPRPPIDPSEVRIFETAPPGSIHIAQLQANSGTGFGTQGQTDAAIARMKRDAAALGANGIVIMGVGNAASPVNVGVGGARHSGNVGIAGSVGIPTTQRQAAGVAIYVPESSLPPAQP